MKSLQIIFRAFLMLGVISLASCLSTAETSKNEIQTTESTDVPGIFTLDGPELLKYVDSVQFDEYRSVKIVNKETVYRFIDSDTIESTYRFTYQIADDSGLENWSALSFSYKEWYEEKPEITVRITRPDGKQVYASPDDIMKSDGTEKNGAVYSDSTTLHLAFPQVSIGAVVEEEIKIIRHAMIPGSGVSFSRNVLAYSGAARVSVQVQQPADLKLKKVVFDLNNDLSYSEEKLGDHIISEYVYTHYPYKDSNEKNLPLDYISVPHVSYSTSDDWEYLGSLYSNATSSLFDNPGISLPGDIVVSSSVRETAIQLASWLEKTVRYTGIELGENSIIPHDPQTILDRHYGDCKDKATLLVILLEQAGIDAHLALVRSGSALDISPDLPSLDVFNHAIVYIPNDGDSFWLDPTTTFNKDDYLPYWDQNRWALIIDGDNSRIEKTVNTSATKTDLAVMETVSLAGKGKGTSYREYIMKGNWGLYYRDRVAEAGQKQFEERLFEKVSESMENGKLEEFRVADPYDYSKPFSLQSRISDYKLASTSLKDAAVAMEWSEILSWISADYKQWDLEEREHPFYIKEDSTFTFKTIVNTPEGYSLDAVTENASVGSPDSVYMQFSSNTNAQGNIVLSFSFETRQGQMSAQDYVAFIKDFSYFINNNSLAVQYKHKLQNMFAERRYTEALEEARILIEKEPDNSLNLFRYAAFLEDLKLIEPAIDTMEKAVVIDPEDWEYWYFLARLYSRGFIGNTFGEGAEMDKSMEAYKKAVALTDDDAVRDSLNRTIGVMHLFDPDGRFLYDKNSLQKGQEILETLLNKDDSNDVSSTLLRIYLETENMEGLKKISQIEASIISRFAAELMYALFQDENTDIFKVIPPQFNDEDKQKILGNAIQLLLQSRHYEYAAAIMEALNTGSNTNLEMQQRIRYLQNLNRWNEVEAEENPVIEQARTFVAEFPYKSVTPGVDDLQDLHPVSADYVIKNHKSWKKLLQEYINSARGYEYSYDTLTDFKLMSTRYKINGDPQNGYRVFMQSESEVQIVYFAPDTGDGLKVVAADGFLIALLKYFNELLEHGKYDQLRVWLGWYEEDFINQDLDKVTRTPRAYLWQEGNLDDPQYLRFLVTILNNIYFDEEYELSDYQALYKEAQSLDLTPDNLNAVAFLLSRFVMYKGAPLEAIEMLNTLPSYLQRDIYVISRKNMAYRIADQPEKSETLLKDALESRSSSQDLLYELYHHYVYNFELDKAIELFETTSLRSDKLLYNNLAWAYLFTDEDVEEALDYALQATQGKDVSRAALHTVACIYAELGMSADAMDALERSIGNDLVKKLDGDDYYVIALVMETMGLNDYAIKYYQKVEEPEYKTDNSSTYNLAQKRLLKLM